MSVGTIYIANRGTVLNNSVGSVNLFPWVQNETVQRGSLAAVRYVAPAALLFSITYLVE